MPEDYIYNKSGAGKREERQTRAEERYSRLRELDSLTPEQFEQGLSYEFGPCMDERFGELIVKHDLFDTALHLGFHEDPRIAFRASWALEWAFFDDMQRFGPYIPAFLDNYLRVRNPSAHRVYTKMLCHMMRKGLLDPDALQAEQIVEKTFDLLIHPDTKVAVKVWCGEILFDLSPRFDWVEEHLAETIRIQMEQYPSPAMLNHGAKLLKRISARCKKNK